MSTPPIRLCPSVITADVPIHFSANKIIPAQVPHMGLWKFCKLSHMLDVPLLVLVVPSKPMAVDSPPGKTIPSRPCKSSGVRTFEMVVFSLVRRDDMDGMKERCLVMAYLNGSTANCLQTCLVFFKGALESQYSDQRRFGWHGVVRLLIGLENPFLFCREELPSVSRR